VNNFRVFVVDAGLFGTDNKSVILIKSPGFLLGMDLTVSENFASISIDEISGQSWVEKSAFDSGPACWGFGDVQFSHHDLKYGPQKQLFGNFHTMK
jgi:hypothetical protein